MCFSLPVFPLFKNVWKCVHYPDLVTEKEYFCDQEYGRSHGDLAQVNKNYSLSFFFLVWFFLGFRLYTNIYIVLLLIPKESQCEGHEFFFLFFS